MHLRRFLQARQPTAADAGFTLIEVIVSMMLLTMVATAAFALFIHVLQSSKGMDSRSAAITVAQQAMDNARSVSPLFDVNGHSAMVAGRQQSLVTAQFTNPPVGVDVSATYPDYDSAAVSTSTPVIPMTNTATVSNQTFNVATVIGQCVLTQSTGVCGKTIAGSTPPARTALAAGTTLVERVIISVTWSNPNACSTPTACSYTVATLIDPANNPQFSVYILHANNDIYSDPCSISSSTVYTCSASLAVLSNDSGKFGVNAVNQVTAPAHGTLNTLSVGGNPAVTYVPTDCTATNNAYTGVDTFQYNATDIHGDTTNTALVTVTVAPPPTPTAGSTSPSWSINAQSTATTQTLATAIPSGSVGAWCNARTAVTSPTLVSTSPQVTGVTLTAAGTGSTSNITVGTPAGWSGKASFTYTLTDAFGQVSPVLTGSLAVLPTAPAVVGSVYENVTSTDHNSTSASVTGVGSGLTYALASTPAHGVASLVGSTLTYTPATGTAGTDTFLYKVTDTAGQSVTATVTITVNPPPGPIAYAVTLKSCPASKSQTTFDFGTTYASYAVFYAPIGTVPLTATTGIVKGSTATASGLIVTYKTGSIPPVTTNTLFTFYLTDANSSQSKTVSVTC